MILELLHAVCAADRFHDIMSLYLFQGKPGEVEINQLGIEKSDFLATIYNSKKLIT